MPTSPSACPLVKAAAVSSMHAPGPPVLAEVLPPELLLPVLPLLPELVLPELLLPLPELPLPLLPELLLLLPELVLPLLPELVLPVLPVLPPAPPAPLALEVAVVVVVVDVVVVVESDPPRPPPPVVPVVSPVLPVVASLEQACIANPDAERPRTIARERCVKVMFFIVDPLYRYSGAFGYRTLQENPGNHVRIVLHRPRRSRVALRTSPTMSLDAAQVSMEIVVIPVTSAHRVRPTT